MNTVKAAEKRILNAETLLDEINEDLRKAFVELSVIVGLGQQCPKLRKLGEEVKKLRYSLRDVRESGVCDLDSTTAAMLPKKKKRA